MLPIRLNTGHAPERKAAMAEYFTKDGDNFVPVKDRLHTQSEVDNAIENRIERERNKFSDYNTLKEQVGTLTKELEEKTKTWETKESEFQTNLKKAGLETEKVKITHEFKLSDELAEFVTGETPEEMRQRAEKLAKSSKGGTIKIDKEEKPEDKGSTSKAIAGKLFGKKSDD